MNQPSLKITLWIYSGEENPEWVLDPMQMMDLILAFNQKKPMEPMEVQPRSGYAGFKVEPVGQGSEKFPGFRVFNRVIWSAQGGKKEFYSDEGGVETILLQQAVAKGFGQDVPFPGGSTQLD